MYLVEFITSHHANVSNDLRLHLKKKHFSRQLVLLRKKEENKAKWLDVL